jgi:hypothetical protein
MNVCSNAGLHLAQNKPGGWRGYFPCPSPRDVQPNVRYFYAHDETEPTKPDFDWRNERVSVEAGVQAIKRYLAIVEKFQ